jgi:phosphatidate cytidylyltransferase
VSELVTRTITGIAIVAVVIFATIYSPVTLCTLWGVLAFIGVKEIYSNKMGGFLGAFLVVFTAVSTVSLGLIGDNGIGLLALLSMVWANDVFAYLGGRVLGRKIISRGLAPSISPNKSWEGAVIGAVAATVVGYVWFMPAHFYIGTIVGVLATCGDLVQSKAKRSAGVKDTGTLFPGHGGVLDRFDGLLLAAPMLFIILFFLLP